MSNTNNPRPGWRHVWQQLTGKQLANASRDHVMRPGPIKQTDAEETYNRSWQEFGPDGDVPIPPHETPDFTTGHALIVLFVCIVALLVVYGALSAVMSIFGLVFYD